MNHIRASCGHYVIAVGSPGSKARTECEETSCEKCLLEKVDKIIRGEDDDPGIDQQQYFPGGIN